MTGAPFSPEHWAGVQALFLDALDRTGPDREAFLVEACGGDAALRAEVESLVAAHERGGPIAEPVSEAAPATGLPGSLRWVGPYRLVVELGQGGMGSVYLAEREGDGFTQRVALKLMRPDYADSRVVAHLEAERRILARLEHPGIARFIDGGTTPSRQPYIAMEYVDGTPLLEYCARQGLDARQRVALFAEVCDAVQYAHGQLVVHRDLKPGNVMVTRDGAPKLLDFGVATVLSDVSPDPARQTADWLTPAYASPEQLRREPVTVQTDVHALGLVLYELLTGERPYHLGDGSWETILRTVTEVTPDGPSRRLKDAGRSLPKALATDLDLIVLKALAKEPSRRYRSAEQLGDDLRRWLRGDPVRAQPDRLGYRVGKFVRRHRTLVAVAAVAMVSLIGGIAATAWQARVAGRERDTAQAALRRSEDVTRFLLGLFEASDPRGGVDTLTGRALLQTGLARVDELSDQPLVQAAMLDALGQVLVGRGRPADGLRLHDQGAALRAKVLGDAHPELAASHRFAAIALRNLARYPEAEARLREALRLEVAAYGEGTLETTESLIELGFLLPYLGRMEASESLYRQAYTIRAAALGDTSLATLRTHLVLGLRMRNRDPEGSEAALRRVVVLADGPGDEAALLRAQAMIHLGDVVILRRGDRTEAEQLFRDALAIQRGRLGDRSLTSIHGLGSLADVRAAEGDFAEAAALLEERIAINAALLGVDHPSTIMSVVTMASLRERQGRYAEAEAIREEGLDRVRRAVGDEHALVAGGLADIANTAGLRGADAKAERLMREAIAMRIRLHGPEHHLVYRYRAQRAMYLSRLGRQAEAEHEVTAALAALEAELAPEHEHVRFAREAHAEVMSHES